MVYRWLKNIQEILYPPACALCGAPVCAAHALCPPCERDLPRNKSACPRCAAPVGADRNAPCGECQRRPPPYSHVHAPFRYEHPLDFLIQDLKFNGRLACAPLLGTLLAETLAGRDAPLPERIIPVPLHRTRLWRRGFNQSLEIARTVSARLGVPLDTTSCTRVAATAPQSGLPAAERRRNVRGAFAVRKKPLPWRHVAVLDDVVTTGHTAAELARALKQAGAETVEVWACARAAPPPGRR